MLPKKIKIEMLGWGLITSSILMRSVRLFNFWSGEKKVLMSEAFEDNNFLYVGLLGAVLVLVSRFMKRF